MRVRPQPRQAAVSNCIVISVYGASFLFFLMTWMDRHAALFTLKFALLYGICVMAHLLILLGRQRVYNVLCRLTGRRIRFFEFPFCILVGLLYVCIFFVFPFVSGLVRAPGGVATLLESEDLAMYIVFSGGAAFVVTAISGLDVFPT